MMLSGRYENWHQWRSVIYGQDAIDHLPAELDRFKVDRVLLVTTPSILHQSHILDSLSIKLGSRYVGIFGDCCQYTPQHVVEELISLAVQLKPDLLIGVGGGSVMDTTKAVSIVWGDGVGEANMATLEKYHYSKRRSCSNRRRKQLSTFAFPTTLSGAEYTGMAGVTSSLTGLREPYYYEPAAPEVIFLDPSFAATAPDSLWGSTGIKCLLDAFEQYCTGTAGPMVGPLVLRAIYLLLSHMPASLEGDLEARLQCQIASWLTFSGLFNTGTKLGIGAAIRHQLGMIHNIPHGIATCAIAAEVVRRSVPEQTDLASALSSAILSRDDGSGEDMAIAINRLLQTLDLPQSLRQLALSKSDIGLLTESITSDFAAKSRTARRWSNREVGALLEAAW